MDKYLNKYRVASARLQKWDYGWNAAYFALSSSPPASQSPQSESVSQFTTESSITSNGLSKNHFGPQSENLASIIRGFKIGVTKCAHEIGTGFKWQSRYHDHIIRDDVEYGRIVDYIQRNPQKWYQKTFF